MSEGRGSDPQDQPEQAQDSVESGVASRRQLLRLGAGAGAVVLTVRPGIAQAATSVLNCQIPVPDPARQGQAIAPDGTVKARGTPGTYAGGRTFTGEQVRTGMRGGRLPNTTTQESQAYLNYVRKLQHGRAGFTCYASLMMPR